MQRINRRVTVAAAVLLIVGGLLAQGLLPGWGAPGGKPVAAAGQPNSGEYDVRHYRIDAWLNPTQQELRARTEVTFVPAAETRSVIFELNGSLTLRQITRVDAGAPVLTVESTPAAEAAAPEPPGKPRLTRANAATRAASSPAAPVPGNSSATVPGKKDRPADARTATPAQSAKDAKDAKEKKAVPGAPAPSAGEPVVTDPTAQSEGLSFIQDNRENMNVRVDLGSVVPAGQEVTLAFEYAGALESPQGGPLPNARLAAVSPQGSYLFYAARWFPFHDYAADRATYEIRIRVPKGETVACYSDRPVTIEEEPDPQTKAPLSVFTFASQKPILPGSLAAGKYLIRSSTSGAFVVDFYVKAGDESWADRVGPLIGSHLEFYSSQFGPYSFGRRLLVVETDEETLETYSGAGIMFVSPRALTASLEEKLAREVAYQWWGQTVGLRSFDDTLLSQGMAEFSALLYIAVNGTATQYQQALQAQLEKALAFEQSSSIRNAPSQLDDQSSAFRSVIFHKGALVFNMLRQLIGNEVFDQMLRNYYTQYAGRNITLEEFESMASAAAGRDLRFFFGQWIDSTGVPEFRTEYRVLRNREGFRVPGTIRQDLDTFEMPVEILLRTESGSERKTLMMQGTSVDFDLQSKTMPLEVIVDPDARIVRSSEELRQAVIVRRGIEHLRQEEYVEAEQQFQAAIKLSRSNSWAWYNLGLLYMTQRNWNRALDAFDQGLNGVLRPDWIEVWSYIYRGNCWDMIGQRERAVSEYNKAVTNGTDYDKSQAAAQAYLAQPYGRKPTPPTPEEKPDSDGQ